MEKLQIVENDWNGEVDCTEVMGIKMGIQNWKSSWPYSCGE